MPLPRYRTYGRPNRKKPTASNIKHVSKPFQEVKSTYWSDEESPKVLRKTPDPFDLLLQDEFQKANAIIHHLSSQLSPDPINNLSDTSCSPITPLVEKITAKSKKFSKREYKNRKKDSDYSDDESYHSKIGNTKKDDSHTNNQISVTSKKSSKRKYRYKKRAPLFENDEKENHKDLENYNLIVKAVEKKDNICDVKILNAVKGSSVYLRNKKENKNSLNTMLKEIVNDNVSCVKISENSNSSSSRGILKNSTSAVHSIKEHTPTKDITPIFSTPRKTEFDGFGCENDVSAIAFHRVSKLNVSDDICEKRSIESVAESTFRSENSICSQNRNSPDIFNHSLENTDLSIVNKTPAFTELPPVQKIKKLTNNNSVIDYDLSSNNLSHSNENLSPCKENESRTVFSEIKPNNASQNKFTCDSIDNKEQQINNEKKFDSDLYIHKTRSNFHKFGNNLANIIILEENESIIELMDNTIEPQFTPDILEEIVNCNTITMRKTSIMPSSDEDVTIRDTENTRFIDENVTIEDFNKSHSIDGNVSIEDFDKSHSIVDAENAIIDENLTIKNFENTHFIDENVTIEDFNKSHSIVDSENATNCQDFHSVMEETAAVQDFENSFTLLSGKKWQRSQNLIRNFNVTNMTLNELDRTLKMDGLRRGRKYREGVERVYNLQNKSVFDKTSFSHATFASTTFMNKGRKSVIRGPLHSFYQESGHVSELLLDPGNGTGALSRSRLSISRFDDDPSLIDRGDECVFDSNVDARSIVLRKCDQYEPLPFHECYPESKLQKCHKIGEGVYGEVYLIKNEDDPQNPIVMKVIPIEGLEYVNGERQKQFKEILSEITIAKELSELRNNELSNTPSFNKVYDVRCVQGTYPKKLKESWEDYDELKGSENDYPDFCENQLYIVLELENGGKDIEAFEFWNAKQSYALFFQIAYALAVAEETLEFEHRDLHWGNILVKPSDDEIVKFTISGLPYSIPTCGVFANIIDYTLSRISIPKVNWVIYNDLTDDDLFNSHGDYQFEIYRLMRDEVGNSWGLFKPYTNILWLHYILLKMINGLRYQKKTTKVHKLYLSKIQKLADKILDYESCLDFVHFEKCDI